MANSYLDKLYKSFGDLFARSVNGVKPDASGNISLSLPDSYDLPKATDKTLGGVTIGSNISVSDGKISLSKANVTSALGYTPPAQDTVYTLPNASENTVGGVKIGQNITVSAGTISLTKANVTTALGYVPSSTNATYSVFTGATSSSAGVAGLVPAPSAGKQKMYLRADGSWSEPTNTVYDNATQTVAGLMSKDDKTKLDGIAVGANKYIHPSYSAQSNKLYKVTVDSQGHVSATSEVTKADIVALGIPAEDTKATLSSLGVTAIASELNVLDGITATTAELNYCDGVTSNIQTQLNSKLSTTGTASKATADASGNNIVNTYATKTELNNSANAKIAMSGSRGTLAGYNTPASSSSALTIDASSNDDIIASSAIAITVSNGSSGQSWVKTVAIANASTTITLGSSWNWVGGLAPKVVAKSVLILKWTGSFGLANLVVGV